eukprot:3371483-Rhodomonas_salina.1
MPGSLFGLIMMVVSGTQLRSSVYVTVLQLEVRVVQLPAGNLATAIENQAVICARSEFAFSASLKWALRPGLGGVCWGAVVTRRTGESGWGLGLRVPGGGFSRSRTEAVSAPQHTPPRGVCWVCYDAVWFAQRAALIPGA